MPYGGTPDHIPERQANLMALPLMLLNALGGLKPPSAITDQMAEIISETGVGEVATDLATYGAIV